MKQRQGILKTLILLCSAWCLPLAVSAPWNPGPQDQQKAPSKPAPKVAQSSMTGCVDQAENGDYILIHEKTRDKVTQLVADGFPTEGFAKHLGQKVSVRGTAGTDGPSPTFRVRNIEVISDGCAPQ